MKTARPLNWHKLCLEGIKSSLRRYEVELAQVQSRVDKVKRDVAFYTHQIEEAERRGKGAFDCDRFLVPRKRKT